MKAFMIVRETRRHRCSQFPSAVPGFEAQREETLIIVIVKLLLICEKEMNKKALSRIWAS